MKVMKIKQIELYNFRQYKGKHIIKFSCDNDKNVTVLVGENNSGKTTFIRAFEWCLYETNEWQDKALLNKDVVSEMDVGATEEVYVTLNIEINEAVYIIKRTQKYTCTKKDDVKFDKSHLQMWENDGSGNLVSVEERYHEENINRIIPKEFAVNFFFGGERLARITERTELTDAVKRLTGITYLDTIEKHLKGVINKWTSSLETNPNTPNFQEKIQELEKGIPILESQLESKQSEMDYWEEKVSKCTEQLILHQQTREYQEDLNRKSRHLNVAEKSYQDSQKKLIGDFNQKSVEYFLYPLVGKVQGILDQYQHSRQLEEEQKRKELEAQNTEENLPNINKDVFRYIRRYHKCICGAVLNEGSPEWVRLQEYTPKHNTHVERNPYDESCRDYKNYLSKHSNGNVYYEIFERDHRDYLTYRKDIGDTKEDIKNLNQKIDGCTMVDSIVKEKEDALRQKNKISKQVETLQKEIYGKNLDIERLKKQLRNYNLKNEKNVKLQMYIDYTTYVKNWISDEKLTRESQTREKLENYVNSNFSKIYHGSRKIIIDDKYRVKYLDVTTEENDGLKVVKNFAFVVGLIELAKEKLATKEESEEANIQHHYPLVMDAPFSHADETHIQNICSILPNSASQVIISIMDKDWQVAKNTIYQYVGKTYSIKKALDENGHEIETVTTVVEEA